ncbi:MAG: MBL fold metallo-hydrolase, partial [Rikenellaceae bacterium]
MKLTILGSGTSQGVPIIGCQCEVCRSKDPRDIRLRSSAMVEWRGMRIVVDAGPDFRLQMLREGVRQIDALLLTHHHQDHAGGIDDTRALTFIDYPIIRRLQLYATAETIEAIKRHYDYAFAESKYLGAPEIDLQEIVSGERFRVSSEDGAKSVEDETDRVEVEVKSVEDGTDRVEVEVKSVEVEAIRGTHAKGLEV